MRISFSSNLPPRVRISSSTFGKSNESMMWPCSSMVSTNCPAVVVEVIDGVRCPSSFVGCETRARFLYHGQRTTDNGLFRFLLAAIRLGECPGAEHLRKQAFGGLRQVAFEHSANRVLDRIFHTLEL